MLDDAWDHGCLNNVPAKMRGFASILMVGAGR